MNRVFFLLTSLLIIQIGCVSRPSLGLDSVQERPSSAVHRICFEKVAPAKISSEKLSRNLIDVQKRFSNQKFREQNSTEFIDNLEKIIGDTEYKFLLQCKADWERQKNHRIRVAFPKDLKHMELADFEEVGSDGQTYQILEVHFWLSASVQQVLPTYMHELLHVCQREETLTLQKRFDDLYSMLSPGEKWTVAKKLWGDQSKTPKGFKAIDSKAVASAEEAYLFVNRNKMITEIAAMMLMRKAYIDFVNLDPGYCEEDSVLPEKKRTLAQGYDTANREFEKGYFAQRVLTWYGKIRSEGLYIPKSRSISYPASNNGTAFKMKHLDPVFKKQIEALGIPVLEDFSVENEIIK